jgi:hypothetical protein
MFKNLFNIPSLFLLQCVWKMGIEPRLNQKQWFFVICTGWLSFNNGIKEHGLTEFRWVILFLESQWSVNHAGLVWFGFMVFNIIFINISAISWRSVLLVVETGGPGENHWPAASHWQTLSHNVVLLALSESRTYNISGDRHWLHR